MAERTIILKGRGIQKEGVAGATITPGELVTLNSSNEVIPHGTAAGNAQAAFAKENEVIGGGIDDTYASGDNVIYEVLPPGAEVYALVAAAAGAIVIGDYLESAGDGTLRKLAASASTAQSARNSVVARAIEAVDNSGGGARARIKVEVI